jgi:hypothetical protein
VTTFRFPPWLRCEQCAKTSDDHARGWRAYRSDLTAEAEAEDTSADDVPVVVYYCPACAARQFGA